jgi:hypothetical protein
MYVREGWLCSEVKTMLNHQDTITNGDNQQNTTNNHVHRNVTRSCVDICVWWLCVTGERRSDVIAAEKATNRLEVGRRKSKVWAFRLRRLGSRSSGGGAGQLPIQSPVRPR